MKPVQPIMANDGTIKVPVHQLNVSPGTIDSNGVVDLTALDIGQVFDVSDYGAMGDGVADDTVAIQAAITAAMASSKGGTVYFPRPAVYYKCTGQLDLDGAYSVTLLGTGAPLGLGGTTTGALVYTGSGATAFITARASQGLTIRNLRILYTSATFTGDLIDLSGNVSDTSFALIDSCELRGSSSSNVAARSLINVFTAIVITIRNSQFTYADIGILGKTVPGYSNVINIENNTFVSLETASIKNAGEQWNIVGNTFEPLRSGKAGAYTEDQASYSVVFDKNWFGDVSVTGTPWILWGGNFLTVSNNLIGSAGAAQAGIVLGIGSAITSATFIGNGYNNPTTCIATAGGAAIDAFNSYGDATLAGTYLTDALSQIARKNIIGQQGNALYNTEILNAFAAQYTTLADITTNDPDKNHIGFFDGDVGGTNYAFGLASRADGETPIELFTGNATPNRRLKVTTSITSYVPLIFSADNTHDVGAAGATRPRTIYAGTSVVAPTISATARLGYAVGSGATANQGTSRVTAVTCNAACGNITLFSTAGSTSYQSFTVNNTSVEATDKIILNQISGTDKYILLVTAVAGNSFEITFATTGGTTSEAPVIGFTVIKAVTS